MTPRRCPRRPKFDMNIGMDHHGWDARYSEKALVWSAEPNQFLPPIVERLGPGTALDLACGEGRNAIWLARRGWDVTGVDYSSVGIEKARKIAGDEAITWQVADITVYDPVSRFDLVIIVYVHVDDDDMRALFERATAALAPGGTLIAVGHALRNLTDGVGGPSNPDILWSVDRMTPLVGNLNVVSLGEVLRPVTDSDVDAIDILVHATKA
jgi:SAM-dependent methyltransferase